MKTLIRIYAAMLLAALVLQACDQPVNHVEWPRTFDDSWGASQDAGLDR